MSKKKIFIYILRKIIIKEKIYNYNKLDIYILILTLAFIISTIFSKVQALSLAELGAYIITILFGVAVRNIASDERYSIMILGIINISSILVCLYGFYQAIFDKPIQKSWLDPSARNEITFRVFSTFENPNLLAIFLVIVIPIALFLFLNTKKSIGKVYYAASIVIFTACLALTFSRTGMLGLAAAIIIFIMLMNIRYIIFLLIGGVALIPFLPASIINRIKSMGLHDSTVEYRFKIWETTMEMIRDNPITGVGYGSSTYMEVYRDYLGRTKIVAHAHNTFLQIWAESGIVGIIAFLIFILQIYFNYIKTIIQASDKMQKLMLILGISVITGFLVNGIAEHSFFYYKNMIMFYLVFFLTSRYLEPSKKS